ncbi:MAG: NAD(P)H-hydrate dehydratase [Desulfobacterales bacterium]
MNLVTASQMQAMDRETISVFGIPGRVLMEIAGRGATDFLLERFPDLTGRKLAVAAGPGNNGGDGFVMARCLAQRGFAVSVYLLCAPERVQGDAAANLNLLAPLSVPVVAVPDEAAFAARREEMAVCDVWIDAILGTGLTSEVRGFYRSLIQFINRSGRPVFAVDIPSGLNADTGQPCGACIRAQATATFGLAKTGHFLHPGVSFRGDLRVVDIGIPPHIVAKAHPRHYLLTPQDFASALAVRPVDAHKGSTGHLLVLAGAPGKTGAAAMTAISALRSGAGLVSLGVPAGLNAVLETLVIEAMTVPLPAAADGGLGSAAGEEILGLLPGKKCLALGPGLGTGGETRALLRQVLAACPLPLVIDADGLNCLAAEPGFLKRLDVPVILTPHPGEMARLTGTTVQAVQADRIACARDFAWRFNVHLVLKGAGTVVAHPDGAVYVNPTGNPGMAAGGMGDVLTGVIAGLVTRGVPPAEAARAGVYLHGRAADGVAHQVAPFGYLASEVMAAIPRQFRELTGGADSAMAVAADFEPSDQRPWRHF